MAFLAFLRHEYAIYTFSAYGLTFLCAVWAAFVRHRRRYGAFGFVLGFVVSFVSSIVFGENGFPLLPFPLYMYLLVVTFVNLFANIRPTLKPLWYRILVSIPSAWYMSATVIAVLYLPFAPFIPEIVFILPFLIAAVGVYQSLTARFERVDVVLDGQEYPELTQLDTLRMPADHTSLLLPTPTAGARAESRTDAAAAGDQERMALCRPRRPLRLFQLTDCHLGPFQSIKRLQTMCAQALAQEPPPDLVLITGDLITMESHFSGTAIQQALAPLRAMPGRVFACLGNHDYEALELVEDNLRAAGVRLLKDEEAVVDVPDVGPVQIIGAEFYFTRAAERLASTLQRLPRRPGTLRLLLLHNPSHVVHVPRDDADLVLSGHYHGGQLGLLSLGLRWTVLRACRPLLGVVPDHGLWGLGRVRVYAHRGSGHYGFPLRIGVPSEQCIMHVHYGDSC